MSEGHDANDEGLVRRAIAAEVVLGGLAAAFAWIRFGGFSGRSVALGSVFAALHLVSVSSSVRATYAGGVSPAARFFVVLRSLRFLAILAAAAFVLVLELASALGFLAGYALLVPAIASAPFTSKLGRTQ